ncbi:unnamed protein product [Nippostrongylus brasiliensis]|uniref:HNH endonuclease n=1 Tax=Nippostrongylus brasiliensis TaxID=27835 RepID=A0A0N4XDG4_NIPBR|nr:unnamed protein product [Nippostrongylus brasiliensis]
MGWTDGGGNGTNDFPDDFPSTGKLPGNEAIGNRRRERVFSGICVCADCNFDSPAPGRWIDAFPDLRGR